MDKIADEFKKYPEDLSPTKAGMDHILYRRGIDPNEYFENKVEEIIKKDNNLYG